MLDGHLVPKISPLLNVPGATIGMPYRLKANESKSFIGSYVLGMGFVLTPEEAQRLIARNPRNREVLFPYLNGEDLNSRPDQSPSRWVINFHDWLLERAQTYLEPFNIVQEKVKPEREKIAFSKSAREKWWLFERSRSELYETIKNMKQVLVRSRIANQHTVVFVSPNWIYNEKVVIFPEVSLTILQSNIHETWARSYSSTLKSDMQYTPSDCFETFPFPASLAGGDRGLHNPEPRTLNPDPLEQIGETYHEHRRQLMLARQEGLTKTYNRFHDQREAAADIAELRRLHVEMDNAVAAAYGWVDLDLGHGFHQTRQGLRYTISEPVRRTVLDRLLLLNHQRYAEEVALGLHDKGAKKAGGSGARGRPRKNLTEGQGQLF